MPSAIYQGFLSHQRFQPRPHDFRYRIFMLYLDLSELTSFFDRSPFWSLERFNWAGFRRSDFINPEIPDLKAAVQREIFHQTGQYFTGDVHLLTHIRYLGYCFNPVSFYYCHENGQLRFILAEVNNTPWNERFCYVLTCDPDTDVQSFAFAKAFHVSPFLPMNMQYHWRFTLPGEQMTVFMRNRQQGQDVFHANLQLERQEATTANLNRILWRFPAMTLKTSAAIYWQALLLWAKRIPFHDHPSANEASDNGIINSQSSRRRHRS